VQLVLAAVVVNRMVMTNRTTVMARMRRSKVTIRKIIMLLNLMTHLVTHLRTKRRGSPMTKTTPITTKHRRIHGGRVVLKDEEVVVVVMVAVVGIEIIDSVH
jgi:hypothetical protein